MLLVKNHDCEFWQITRKNGKKHQFLITNFVEKQHFRIIYLFLFSKIIIGKRNKCVKISFLPHCETPCFLTKECVYVCLQLCKDSIAVIPNLFLVSRNPYYVMLIFIGTPSCPNRYKDKIIELIGGTPETNLRNPCVPRNLGTESLLLSQSGFWINLDKRKLPHFLTQLFMFPSLSTMPQPWKFKMWFWINITFWSIKNKAFWHL